VQIRGIRKNIMAKSKTHNEIMLRPPPGTRFTVFGSDVLLEFQRGRERDVFEWLGKWMNDYVYPEVLKAERGPVDPNPEISRLKAKLEEMQKNGHAPVPSAEPPAQPAPPPQSATFTAPNAPHEARTWATTSIDNDNASEESKNG
jgi:hypothetical protein